MRLVVAVFLLLSGNQHHAQTTNYKTEYESQKPSSTPQFSTRAWELAAYARETNDRQDNPYDARKDCLYRFYLLFTILGSAGAVVGIGVLIWQTTLVVIV